MCTITYKNVVLNTAMFKKTKLNENSLKMREIKENYFHIEYKNIQLKKISFVEKYLTVNC